MMVMMMMTMMVKLMMMVMMMRMMKIIIKEFERKVRYQYDEIEDENISQDALKTLTDSIAKRLIFSPLYQYRQTKQSDPWNNHGYDVN